MASSHCLSGARCRLLKRCQPPGNRRSRGSEGPAGRDSRGDGGQNKVRDCPRKRAASSQCCGSVCTRHAYPRIPRWQSIGSQLLAFQGALARTIEGPVTEGKLKREPARRCRQQSSAPSLRPAAPACWWARLVEHTLLCLAALTRCRSRAGAGGNRQTRCLQSRAGNAQSKSAAAGSPEQPSAQRTRHCSCSCPTQHVQTPTVCGALAQVAAGTRVRGGGAPAQEEGWQAGHSHLQASLRGTLLHAPPQARQLCLACLTCPLHLLHYIAVQVGVLREQWSEGSSRVGWGCAHHA